MVHCFERWALIHAGRTEAARLDAIGQQKRRESEDELARHAYIRHTLGEKLLADLEAWELTGRLQNYLAATRSRIEQSAGDEDPSAAMEWLNWCE